jgi:hypothetical protein
MNAQCRIDREEMIVAQKPLLRPVPDDFEVVFVEQGRLECEAWYHARRTTVTRWLEECGKQRLIEKRATFVRHLRERGQKPKPGPSVTGIRDRRHVSRALAQRAANHLRCIRNGGWAVAPVSGNEWLVGTRRRSAAELVDLAVAKGFDRRKANLQIRAEGGED